ncbi:MAG: thiamine pyrophosphate-dependent enzyme, partial [Myxococcota bacterium]
GARFGRPEADIWVVAGDGGFQMTACELSTCAQEGLKVNIALINNRYLGMVRQWQDFFHDKRYVATPLKNPDFLKLAAAHGLDGRRVTARDQVSDAVAWAQAQPGTVVLEFQVLEEDAVYPMVPAGNDIDDMLRRPTKEG